eukprot:jgi/Psemu1/21913/gm1.21913_g
MPEPAVSWNEVRGIHFSFGHHFGCGNKQWKLNTAFAQTLPNIASLFIVDEDGVETLRPDPIPVLKSLIVAAIVDELLASKVFKEHKKRIALLLSNSAIYWHMKDHGRLRVRDKRALDKSARRANNGDPIIRLVLTIASWKFHKDWYPYKFHKAYDPRYGIPFDEAMLQPKTPFHTQITNKLKFNDKLIEQLKRERNGETVQQVLPPKRKRPKTTRPAAAISTFPIKPVESEVKPTIHFAVPCTSESPNSTIFPKSVPIPCAGASTVTANLGPLQPAIWTWTYSPNSESISFRRVRSGSVSFQCATSSSPPVQHRDKSPPCEPTNFRWTFNPQSETVVFHRLPKPAPVPLKPSLQLPLPKANHAGITHTTARSESSVSAQSPQHFSGPSVPPNTAILTVPIIPVDSEAHTAIQVPSSCVTSSSATTNLITNNAIDPDDTATPSNSTARAHHLSRHSRHSSHPYPSSRAQTNAQWNFHPHPDTHVYTSALGPHFLTRIYMQQLLWYVSPNDITMP